MHLPTDAVSVSPVSAGTGEL